MSQEKKIKKVQELLKNMKIDGWLLYDFHRTNFLAHFFLETSPDIQVSRRFFYWIPTEGDPIKIVHSIEPNILNSWPGETRFFISWQSFQLQIRFAVKKAKVVAMEYSPMNENPYIACVDGGTVDLIRSFGIKVVSSQEILNNFISILSQKQGESQIRAATTLDQIVKKVWLWISNNLKNQSTISEYEIQKKIIEYRSKERLFANEPPIVAINAHSADPHFYTQKEGSAILKEHDFLLIDVWGKEQSVDSIFGDITKVAIAARYPTEKQKSVFEVVRRAQKAGIDFVRDRFDKKKMVRGFEVDDVVRNVIKEASFGDYFIHRTGHSITEVLHGSGTHIDNLEMHDTRAILPGTCFSIEPGIYLPGEFGIRLESNVYIDAMGVVQVTGGEQEEIHSLVER